MRMYMQHVQRKYKAVLAVSLILFSLLLTACSSSNIKLEDNIDKLNDSAESFFSLKDETYYGEHFQIKGDIKSEEKNDEENTYHIFYCTLYILPIYEENIKLKRIQITIDDEDASALMSKYGIMLPGYSLPYFQLAKKESKLEEYTCQTVTYEVSVYDKFLKEFDLTVDEFEKALSSININLKYNLFGKDTIVTKLNIIE